MSHRQLRFGPWLIQESKDKDLSIYWVLCDPIYIIYIFYILVLELSLQDDQALTL